MKPSGTGCQQLGLYVPPSFQVRPRPRGALGPRGSPSGRSPRRRGGGRGPQWPNSWVPRLPGVTQRPRPHASRQAQGPGRGPGDRTPRSTQTLDGPSANLSRLPEPHHSLLYLPTPPLPLSFSVSQPRHPGATVPNSVHTRTERACGSHFLELNSRPLRGGRPVQDPRPTAVVRVRRPPRSRRARSHPRACAHSHAARTRANRLLPTPYDSTT